MDEIPAADDGIELLRTNALTKLDEMRDLLLEYHKEVMAQATAIEVAHPSDLTSIQAGNHDNKDGLWEKEKQEIQEKVQELLKRNEQLAMELAQSRCENAQYKRERDQTKHRLVIVESQLEHQQNAHGAHRKQLQIKDHLLTTYRTSIRKLENKVILCQMTSCNQSHLKEAHVCPDAVADRGFVVDQLKTMVETTYHIQEKEISYLANLAAKHPRNNLPKPVSPFIAVFTNFLRRTNGLSLVLLWLLVGSVTYARFATEYGMLLDAPVLSFIYALIFLLGVTPYLGWKGAKTKSWVYLRYYDACIICFLAFLGLGVAGLEYFQADIGNALAIYEASTNHSTVQGTILFPRDDSSVDDMPHPVTNFIQAEADKAFVLFLQARFDAWFPQVVNTNATTSMMLATTNLMSLDPRPWLSRTFNVSAVLYPEPLTETPEWMTDFITTTCANTTLLDGTLLTGFVALPVQPTFKSCLRPILQFCVNTAQFVEMALLALAGLLVIQYGTLLLLKYVDPASSPDPSASTKKAMRKTSSVMHFFDAVLFVLGLGFLSIAGVGIYLVASRPDHVNIDTETRIMEGVSIGFCFVYGVLLCLSAALGCSPKLIQAQSFVLVLAVALQLVLSTAMYLVKTDIAAVRLFRYLPSVYLCDVTWDVAVAGQQRLHCCHMGRDDCRDGTVPCPPTVPYTDDDGAPTTKETTIPFHVALDKYWESYPRGSANDATLAHARQQFTLEWLKVTGASSVHEKDALLTMSQFESIVRVLVLKRLVDKCGLEVGVNISRDGKHLYFKLTAPRKVVAEEAEARKYKLQVRNAVDPGLSFWTARQVAIENAVYDVHTAKQKLCALYGRHALTVVENQFFPNESLAQISRRINVHSREAMFADDAAAKSKKMPPPYRYIPFVPYFRKNAMQYLYQRHSTQLDLPTTDVAPSVFQVTDCMKLLHLVIHDELDTARMISNGLLEGYSCLHAASRFEWVHRTNLLSLSNAWLTYWRPRQLHGEPDPDKRYFVNFLYRIYPFRQPLAEVRAYFGEQIALYFLWLGFYAQCLLIPVACSVLYVVLRHGNYHSYDVDPAMGGVHLRDMGLGLVILVWAFVYAKCWQRKNYMCAIAWGMNGIEDNEHDRADYYGTEQVNPITNEVERVFPSYMRVLFGLQSLNHFSAPFVVAFVKRTAMGCVNLHTPPSSSSISAISHGTNCLPELENLLFVMFVWRVMSNVLGMVMPIAQLVLGSRRTKPTDRYDLEYELSLDTYENTYEDYSEIVVQFGLFTLFIFPLPTSPIFAFVETAINLRMDAYKLCYCTRRPLPRNAQDIGAWFIYLG
ncbi:hypothetical protein DYB32_008857, partial [Aphanomyces invadans]